MDARGWRAWSLARIPRARRRAATSAPHACAWRARHCGTRATPVPCPALRSGETWRGAAARAHGMAGAVQKPEGRAGPEHAGTAATAGRGRTGGLPRYLRAPSAPRDTAPLRGGAWRAKRPRPRDPRQAIGRARRRALPRPPLAPMGGPAQALFPTRSRQKIRPVWPKFAVQARSMGPPGRHHGAERHKSERMRPRAR